MFRKLTTSSDDDLKPKGDKGADDAAQGNAGE